MKNLTNILVLIFALNLYSQADLTMNILLHTADFSGNETIYFGIDSTATDGIDPWLGESNLPPDFCAPWGPSFCAYFIFPNPLVLSYSDFRFGELPFTGQITHKIEVVNYASTGSDSIFIRYDLPEGINIHFTDELGGILINFTIEDSGEIAYLYLSYFRKLWMYVNYNNVVPVELKSFTASVLEYEKAIQLNWTTATETNNSGFEINRKKLEARSQELEWEKIGFVPGFGTTTEPKSYSFIDDLSLTPNLTHTLRYRLKQIDFDGSFEYSNEIEVEVDFTPKEFVLYQNYPNPFNPTTTIKYEIPSVTLRQAQSDIMVSLKVYDVIGNEVATLINEEKQAGIYEVEFDASSLSSGMYLYKIQAGTFVQTKKMILVK